MGTAEILNSVGIVFILSAFILLQIKKVTPHSLTYNIINLIGSALAAYGSFMLKSIPFTVLNVAWVGVAIYGLMKYRSAKRN